MATATDNKSANSVEQVTSVMSERFTERVDGWMYPDGGTPLVRVRVSDQEFMVERRRKPHTAWMRIVTADVEDFDASGFRRWAVGWKLTQ